MITFHRYRTILSELAEKGIHSCRVDSLIENGPTNGTLYLKHDVESRLDSSVKMAKLEAELDHKATYYIQGDLILDETGKAALIEIAKCGHEIAYHYDVLDANDGNYDSALIEFEYYLQNFKSQNFDVKTVCPHGNPTKQRTGWKSNKDFFRHNDIRSKFSNMIDIVVDFPSILPNGIYLSDAGFNIRQINKIASNDSSNESAINDGTSIDWRDIENLVMNNAGVVLSLHPHRFKDSVFMLLIQKIVFAILKNTYRSIKKLPFIAKIASDFYKFTRRF